MGAEQDLQDIQTDKKKVKLYNWKYWRRGRKLKKGQNKAEQLHKMYHLEKDRETLRKDMMKKRRRATKTLVRSKKQLRKLLRKREKMVNKIKNKFDPKIRGLQAKIQQMDRGFKAMKK